MEHTNRPLTKRPRASLACNACRQTKSKCDGDRPTCGRCARSGTGCVYTQSGRDKRMERQEERRANLALISRVKELEARLAALSAQQITPDSTGASVRDDRDRPPGPLQPRHGSLSDAGSRATAPTQSSPESTADAIATGLFDHPPVVDIGYFGSSSNHAFFWSLSASIENVSHRSASRYHEPAARQSHQPAAPAADDSQARPPAAPPLPPAPPPPPAGTAAGTAAAARGAARTHDDSFPGLKTAVDWTTRFFDTVGAVLPFLDESDVLKQIDRIDGLGQGWPAASRSTQALLSIIFAHALHTLDGRPPEPFYRRALGLLDEKTVYIPTVDSLQALLLLASFQQNTQRSMESWAPHYLAVRVSYQLGIHAPASYDYLGSQDKEIRSRLWFAVVNQDRILTAGLARPSLIPAQHVRMDLAELLDPSRPNRTAEMACPKESLVYFRHLISLHEILGMTVDSIYSANISSSSRLALGELVAKTVDLSWRLEQWRDGVGGISPNADFTSWSAAAFDSERYAILLSIFHYRSMMLMHGSLLMRVLERVTGSGQDASSGALQDAALSLLRNYLRAIREWLRLISGILRHRRSFLNGNAVWWTSNYMMLSTCIHSFAFWLLSENIAPSVAILGMHSTEIEALLRESLDTLKLLGGSSIMSRKAHRCLQRYMHFLKSIRIASGAAKPEPVPVPVGAVSSVGGEQADAAAVPASVPAPPANPDMAWSQPAAVAGGLPNEFGSDVIASCIDDMFGSLDQDDFLNTGFLAMESGISDFDAAGFV